MKPVTTAGASTLGEFGPPATSWSTPAAASASSDCAAARSSGSRSSTPSSGPGSQRRRQALWNQAPDRVRRCEMPTTFRPSTSSTSPVPTPPKQISDDHEVQATRPPRCTETPAMPRCSRARLHVSPSQSNARATSSAHNRSSRGTHASTQMGSSGVTSTAPPPDRRRATAKPAARARSMSTTDGRWVDPNTTAGADTRQMPIARRSGSAVADGHPSWSAAALPVRSSIRQPPSTPTLWHPDTRHPDDPTTRRNGTRPSEPMAYAVNGSVSGVPVSRYVRQSSLAPPHRASSCTR